MSKLFVSLGMSLLATASLLIAAEENTPAAADPNVEAARIVDLRMEMMKDRLKLNPEQSEKIRAIMLRDQEKFLKLRDDLSLTAQSRNLKAREILYGSTTEIQALLTPEQKDLWKAEAERQRKEMIKRKAAEPVGKPTEKK